MQNEQDWKDRLYNIWTKLGMETDWHMDTGGQIAMELFIKDEITTAEKRGAEKEREKAKDMISHIRSRNHVCPDCSELCHCYTVCDKMNIEYALKNYEEGR